MPTNPRRRRGFTLLELAIVIAIIGIVAAISGSLFSLRRPRATLANFTAELQAYLYNARQTAMASGHDVGVLVFPDYANPQHGVGRIVMYEDGVGDFFTGGATGGVSFTGYDPATLAFGTSGTRVGQVDVLDLPSGVVVGRDTGLGTAALPAPYTGISVATCCPFCGTGSSRRGAIRFDSHGQVTFYDGTGTTPLAVTSGSSLSLQAPELQGPAGGTVAGTSVLVIFAPSGVSQAVKL